MRFRGGRVPPQCILVFKYPSRDRVNSNTLELWDAFFSEVAIVLGVKLAPRDDPKKSFSPAQSGIILVVHYDTTSWTWSLPEEELIQLLHLLWSFLSVDSCQQHMIWTAVGKLQKIKALVPSGRFNIGHLIRANFVSLERTSLSSSLLVLRGRHGSGFHAQALFWHRPYTWFGPGSAPPPCFWCVHRLSQWRLGGNEGWAGLHPYLVGFCPLPSQNQQRLYVTFKSSTWTHDVCTGLSVLFDGDFCWLQLVTQYPGQNLGW